MSLKNLNFIGLALNEANQIGSELNILLGNFQIYYQNLRGLHWNIRGRRFFELHLKFEELYNQAQINIDDIAERILTLQLTPIHDFEGYLNVNKIAIGKNIKEDVSAIELVVNNIKGLIEISRNIIKMSNEINDEGTNSLISDIITYYEKVLWMMHAFLNE